MNVPSDADALRLRPGEQPTSAHLDKLGAILDRRSPLRGTNVRRRDLPWGTIHHFDGGGGTGGTSPIFRPSVTRRGQGFAISFRRGTIGGVEPTIGGRLIGGTDAPNGVPPVYEIPSTAFNALGEAYIFFRLSFTQAWWIESIEPVAAPSEPDKSLWTAHRLAAIVFSSGSVWRALYTNQGHLALNGTPAGKATHIFWGKF